MYFFRKQTFYVQQIFSHMPLFLHTHKKIFFSKFKKTLVDENRKVQTSHSIRSSKSLKKTNMEDFLCFSFFFKNTLTLKS